MITNSHSATRPHPGRERESAPKLRERPQVLIDSMAERWDGEQMPTRGLAYFATHGTTFMRIRDGYRSEFLQKVLPNHPLIDLGAGHCLEMIEFAAAYGVPKYVAVDRYLAYPDFCADPGIEFHNGDMLRFLMDRPPGSGNIVMNAIDNIILSSRDPDTADEYVGWLLAFISRAVPVGGIAFGLNSPLLGELGGMGFREIRLSERYGIPDNSFLFRREP